MGLRCIFITRYSQHSFSILLFFIIIFLILMFEEPDELGLFCATLG